MLSRVHSHEERRNHMYISVVCHRSCLEVDSRMFAVMLAHMIYILFSNFEKVHVYQLTIVHFLINIYIEVV